MPRLLVRFAALGIGLASFVGMAQDAPARNAAAAHATADPQQPMRHLSRLLDLTPEQVSTLAPVIAQRQQQLSGLRGDTSLDRRARRERLRAIQRDTDAQIQAVLSDSQRQKYTQWKQQLEERRRQEHRPAGGDDRGA